MILASIITTVVTPFATIFGYVLAAFFSVTHSYGLSIMLLTLTTMIVAFPLTQKGTRGMIEMQLIQPELLALRNRYKKRLAGTTGQEKAEINREQQAEMMALYKERGASPTGGCLPLFLQFPIFIVLYDVIRGMTHTITVGTGKAAHQLSQPLYVKSNTAIARSLVAHGGRADFLGFNLTGSLHSHPGASGWGVAPYVIVLLVAVGLQYLSIWQITARNSGSGAAINPQMQTVQKFMPLMFLVFYYAFPAGVGIYFIVSSGFRIGQQAWMYKYDPVIVGSMNRLKEQRKNAPPAPPSGGKQTFRERLAAASGQSLAPAAEPSPPAGRRPTKASGARTPGANRRPNAGPGRATGPKPPMVKPAASADTKKPSPGGARKATGGAVKRPAGNGQSANGSGVRRNPPGTAARSAGSTGGGRPLPKAGSTAGGVVRKQGTRPPVKPRRPDAPRNGNGKPQGNMRPRRPVGGLSGADPKPAQPTQPAATGLRRLLRPR
ncbi:MAG: membrane protein insertase YidC [Acidimicrobiales bacterium]